MNLTWLALEIKNDNLSSIFYSFILDLQNGPEPSNKEKVQFHIFIHVGL